MALFNTAGEQGELQGLRDRVASLERQTSYLQGALDRALEAVQRATDAHSQLIHTVVNMKREGFTPATTSQDLEKLEVDLPDEVLLAIASRAPQGSSLERQLYRWAQQQFLNGADDSSVADGIWKGATPPDEEED